MPDTLLYTLEVRASHAEKVTDFLDTVSEDLMDTERVQRLRGVPHDLGSAELIIHSAHTVAANKHGYVTILKPVSTQEFYDLRALQTFSADGTRLYEGTDYEVLRHDPTQGIGLRILNPRVSSIRFSAGYNLRGRIITPKLPRLPTDQTRTLAESLREAGLTKLHAELTQILSKPENVDSVALVDVARAFKFYRPIPKKLGRSEKKRPADLPNKPF